MLLWGIHLCLSLTCHMYRSWYVVVCSLSMDTAQGWHAWVAWMMHKDDTHKYQWYMCVLLPCLKSEEGRRWCLTVCAGFRCLRPFALIITYHKVVPSRIVDRRGSGGPRLNRFYALKLPLFFGPGWLDQPTCLLRPCCRPYSAIRKLLMNQKLSSFHPAKLEVQHIRVTKNAIA